MVQAIFQSSEASCGFPFKFGVLFIRHIRVLSGTARIWTSKCSKPKARLVARSFLRQRFPPIVLAVKFKSVLIGFSLAWPGIGRVGIR